MTGPGDGRRETRAGIDADVREELDFHLAMRTRENIERGMDPTEARIEAERRFGRPDAYAAQMRETVRRGERRRRRRTRWSELLQDIRYAARTHVRAGRFTGVVVLTLALGIGASATVFSLASRILFTPVRGVTDAGSLVTVTFGRDENRTISYYASHADYVDLRDAVSSEFPLAAADEVEAHVRLPGQETARRVTAEMVTANYAATLGLSPIVGRAPSPGAGDDVRLAMISHSLWMQAFGGSADALGATLTVNGEPFTVTGVAPEGFRGSRDGRVDLWVPVEAHAVLLPTYSAALLTDRKTTVFGRFVARRPLDASPERIEATLRAAVSRIVAANEGSSLEGMIAYVTPGIGITPFARAELSAMLRVLGGIVALVLLLACANAANLLLARATGRAPEFAVRRAIGAGRGRLVRQLVTEGLLLAGMAGVTGVGLAFLAGLALRGRTILANAPPLPDLPVDARVLSFALLASLLTGILFSIVPALVVSNAPAHTLRGRGRATEGRSRLRTGLVIAQIGISLALIVGAGLLVETVDALRDVELGFDPGGVVEASVDPGTQGYDDASRTAFFRSLLDNARAQPGVIAAGLAWAPVQGFMRAGARLWPEGDPADGPRVVRGGMNIVSAGFLTALGFELVSGRDFRSDEVFQPGSTNGGVIIISESAAHALFQESEAVGRRVHLHDASTTVEIVGVIRDARTNSVREPAEALVLEPFGQAAWLPSWATLYVRSSRDAAETIASLRAIADELDGALPLYDAQPVSERIGERLVPERRLASAASVLAMIALILAGVGLYGLMAFAVALRSREFGVRMALGARADDVQRMVLLEGLRTTFAGVALGLLAGLAVARLVSNRLWGVEPLDPLAFSIGALVLLLVAALACWLPAWRATRVDPVTVLRQDT